MFKCITSREKGTIAVNLLRFLKHHERSHSAIKSVSPRDILPRCSVGDTNTSEMVNGAQVCVGSQVGSHADFIDKCQVAFHSNHKKQTTICIFYSKLEAP